MRDAQAKCTACRQELLIRVRFTIRYRYVYLVPVGTTYTHHPIETGSTLARPYLRYTCLTALHEGANSVQPLLPSMYIYRIELELLEFYYACAVKDAHVQHVREDSRSYPVSIDPVAKLSCHCCHPEYNCRKEPIRCALSI